MLIQDVIVEASISDCKASELPSVSVRILAALDGSGDQPELEQLLIEEASVATQVADQVTDLGPD